VAAPQEEAPVVINLMEALQKSLTEANNRVAGAKPARLTAPSVGAAAAGKAKKRKTS
jgi:hypothetical protein